MKQQVYSQALLPKLSSHPLRRPDPSEGKPDDPPDRAAAKKHGLQGHLHGFRQTAKRLPHLDQMRRPYEVWCSTRLVFFRQLALRFFNAPISHYVQRRIQYIQIADFCWFPLFRKTFCDLLVLFFLQFYFPIIAYLPLTRAHKDGKHGFSLYRRRTKDD